LRDAREYIARTLQGRRIHFLKTAELKRSIQNYKERFSFLKCIFTILINRGTLKIYFTFSPYNFWGFYVGERDSVFGDTAHEEICEAMSLRNSD
jgi:hypothetical protein